MLRAVGDDEWSEDVNRMHYTMRGLQRARAANGMLRHAVEKTLATDQLQRLEQINRQL